MHSNSVQRALALHSSINTHYMDLDQGSGKRGLRVAISQPEQGVEETYLAHKHHACAQLHVSCNTMLW